VLELESEQPASQGGAEVIDDRHDQIEGEKQREKAVLKEETDGNLDLLAEPSDPDLDEDKTSWSFPSQRTQQFWKSPCSSPGLSPRCRARRHLVPPACFRRGSTCKKSTLEYTTYE